LATIASADTQSAASEPTVSIGIRTLASSCFASMLCNGRRRTAFSSVLQTPSASARRRAAVRSASYARKNAESAALTAPAPGVADAFALGAALKEAARATDAALEGAAGAAGAALEEAAEDAGVALEEVAGTALEGAVVAALKGAAGTALERVAGAAGAALQEAPGDALGASLDDAWVVASLAESALGATLEAKALDNAAEDNSAIGAPEDEEDGALVAHALCAMHAPPAVGLAEFETDPENI
jgi:hypothetical protein